MALRFWIFLQPNKRQNKKTILTILVYIETVTGKDLVPTWFGKSKEHQRHKNSLLQLQRLHFKVFLLKS